jgi:hypothetical protein
MTALYNNAEGQADEANMSAADNNSGDAWDSVTIATGATVKHDTAQKFGPGATRCYRCATSTTATASGGRWDFPASGAPQYSRIFYRASAAQAVFTTVASFWSGTTYRCGMLIQTNRNVTGRIAGGGQASPAMDASGMAIPDNQWVRLELRAVGHATLGEIAVRLYLDPDAPVEAYDIEKSRTGQNTGGTITNARFGPTGNTANQGPYWMAHPKWSNEDWIGPLKRPFRGWGVPILNPAGG